MIDRIVTIIGVLLCWIAVLGWIAHIAFADEREHLYRHEASTVMHRAAKQLAQPFTSRHSAYLRVRALHRLDYGTFEARITVRTPQARFKVTVWLRSFEGFYLYRARDLELLA